jgi:CelD/BcsL family acetyltransferase involved in cellulose biosynthesis
MRHPSSSNVSAGHDRPHCVPFGEGAQARSEAVADWRRQSKNAAPFLQCEFFGITRPIAEPQGEPILALAIRANRLAGALPLMLSGRVLHSLTSPHTPRFDFLGDSGALTACWEALRTDRRWDCLVLEPVPGDSALAVELPLIARSAGCLVAVTAGARVPYFELPGFEQRLNAKFRANVRRCMRKAGALGFERIPFPSASDLAEAFVIESLAWKGTAGTSINRDPRLEEFYRSLFGIFGPRGQASLCFSTIAGKRVACLVTMEDRHTLYAAKIGYDPTYSNLSPGHLVVAQVAADAERRGLRVFDFLGAQSEWKRKWTEVCRPHVRVIVQRPSVHGYAKLLLLKAQGLRSQTPSQETHEPPASDSSTQD